MTILQETRCDVNEIKGNEKNKCRKAYMRRMSFLFVLAIAYLGMSGCVLAGAPAPIKTKAGKEILVARDIDALARPVWCRGSEALAYLKNFYGLFYYNQKTGKTTHVAGVYNIPTDCTPDGDWLVYRDTDSVGENNFWKYEFKTGKRQNVLLAEESERPIWLNEWPVGDSGRPVGFSDGTVVFDYRRDRGADRNILIAEVYKPERTTVEIYPQFQNFFLHFVDKRNRLYLRVSEKDETERIVRCEVRLEDKELSCETVLEGEPKLWDFSVFSDMETIAFVSHSDTCVKIMRIGDAHDRTECLTATQYGLGTKIVLSPDDKWMAYYVKRRAADGDYMISDLYILNLIKE